MVLREFQAALQCLAATFNTDVAHIKVFVPNRTDTVKLEVVLPVELCFTTKTLPIGTHLLLGWEQSKPYIHFYSNCRAQWALYKTSQGAVRSDDYIFTVDEFMQAISKYSKNVNRIYPL